MAVKARARNRLTVTGLGLDSEWRADLNIGGTVTNPAIAGRAELVRGNYEFAGRRFELREGRIQFDGKTPVNPTLDIDAEADVSDLTATIHVGGTGLKPDISFNSVPSLPQDELLSRILFGTSITNLSAPEALQLASAVGSLQGEGGLDPINAVRKAAGLDRLRIIAADPTQGQGTSLAAGKYLTRKTYVELISDGQGYSATRMEYQVTRWLSLLGAISTLGRQSANLRISKDY
jgi:translocation and assembly module TamB